MPGLKRKPCTAAACRPTPFFQSVAARDASGAFFQPMVQRQPQNGDEEKKKEEAKDPVAEGLKTAGGQLLEHEPFKRWYEPKLDRLKLTLWDRLSTGEKAALLSMLGLQLGAAGTAFALDPKLRASLSEVNIGKALGLIPYSPVEGFSYKLPEAGKSAYGLSADFTLNPYLEALRKRHPNMPLSGATFGLESSYDPSGKGLSLTGGKFGLEFFGGALKAEGKTFKDLSPYPFLHRSDEPGAPASWLMQSVPGAPQIDRAGYQFMINADLLKLFPGLKPVW